MTADIEPGVYLSKSEWVATPANESFYALSHPDSAQSLRGYHWFAYC